MPGRSGDGRGRNLQFLVRLPIPKYLPDARRFFEIASKQTGNLNASSSAKPSHWLWSEQ